MTANNSKIDLKRLRAAIPPHCFCSCPLRSTFYILINGTLTFLAFQLALKIPHTSTTTSVAHQALLSLLWTTYTYIQGLLFTGLWILAHECGHGALYGSPMTNHIVGFLLHSFLLVPYFSWKYTHARHHRYTNHLEKDTVFVPPMSPVERDSKSLVERLIRWGDNQEEFVHDAPLFVLMALVVHQLFGLPAYLFTYATGRSSGRSQNHFNPWSELFNNLQRIDILLSSLGVIFILVCLVELGRRDGCGNVLLLYGVPYLWTNHWIVAITYLHHTHPSVQHFSPEGFSFIDGALATVDRPQSLLFRHAFHGILDWHVVHHLFPRIPFYHAKEATQAIKPLLEDKYVVDERLLWRALWETFNGCRTLESIPGKDGVLRWKTFEKPGKDAEGNPKH